MKISFRKALLIYTLLPISVIFIAFMAENLIDIKNETHQRIEQHMTDLAVSYAEIFDGFLRPIEGAAETNADLIELRQDVTEEDIYELLELQVKHNPIIYGAAVAFMPLQFDKKRRLVAPYVYRKKGMLIRMDIGEAGYDYTDSEWEWWNYTAATGKARWSEPYFDKGGGNILMSTYSVPFFKEGKFWGVATVDISLHEISNQIHIPGVKGHDITVLSSTGMIILFPDQSKIGESIFDVVIQGYQNALELHGNDSADTIEVSKTRILGSIKSMLAGKTGITDLTSLQDREDYWYFFAPIESANWSFSIRVKESEVFESVFQRFWYSLAFFLVLLMLIIISVVLVSGKFSKAMAWLIDRCQRIQRLNFQTVDDTRFNIDEIQQMSNTLDTMSNALDSHFSIQEDVRIAKAIRQQALPSFIPEVDGFQIEIWNHSGNDDCSEIYDVLNLHSHGPLLQQTNNGLTDTVGLLLLDDAESGIDASVKNIQLRAIYRTLVRQGNSLEEIARRMNKYLYLDSSLNGPVQAWFGMLDARKENLVSLNLGHNVVFHFLSEKNSLQRLQETTCSLSAQIELPELVPRVMELADGDIIIVVSDGVTGALNQQREKFGVVQIENQVKKYKHATAGEILHTIRQELSSYTRDAYIQTEFSIIVIKRCSGFSCAQNGSQQALED